VTVTLTEFGVPEFDVTVPKKVDIDATLEERTPGGLGVYLIQNLADSLEYEYDDGRSRVIFTKESGI
jgi:serine/threonine-protein kinase RsbW